jgi:alkanesulfonate monooxygenase SsuD/methylene tetrahydromethanopterin reductase-like flavin-dependent oxidoreductase (luciferase family)
MRIGVSLASHHDVADHHVGAQRMIERAGAAAAAGLEALTVGDHHATATPYYQNVPVLGRMLADWPADRIAGCLFLLPLWHPVLVAEQVGTLAAIHGGTFVVQTGLGGGAQQFAAMGSDLSRRVGDFVESVAVIRALLAGEAVTSERFGIRDAVVAPRPPAGLEWWMGASVDAGLRRVARLRGSWYAGPELTTERARQLLAVYLDACAAAGHRPERLVVRRDVLVADSDAEARRLAEPAVAGGYRGFAPEVLAIGSPATVAQRFAELGELGFTDVMVRQLDVTQDVAVASIGLLAQVRVALQG